MLLTVLLWLAVIGVVVNALLTVLPHFLTPRDRGGTQSDQGVVIFVESIRWMGVRWGMRTAARGLRRAGYEGEFLYWKWHSTWRACLVIPALVDRGMLERQSQRLADYVVRRRQDHPDQPVYLVGYSGGGFVTVRALELLDGVCRVEAAAVLAGAFSPRRDLSAACGSLVGPLVVSSSLADWFIVGLGTLLFGTADRVWTPAVGMTGPSVRGDQCSQVISIRWRPGMAVWGHFGGHFSAASSVFMQRRIARAMGVGRSPTAPHGA
jgi:pimeloyl-ACP methyl ester carboxylesterase